MADYQEKNQFFLFLKLFVVLFVILFILPEIVDGILSIFMLYQAPGGNSMLVSKDLYENMNFANKFLLILKNLIISL